MSDENVLPFDPGTIAISISRHFGTTRMRHWGWSEEDVRTALRHAERVERVGKQKLDVWIRWHGSKKLVFSHDPEEDRVTIITATEGRG